MVLLFYLCRKLPLIDLTGLKQLTGDKVRSRTPERIVVECRLRCEWLNTLIAPAESIAW